MTATSRPNPFAANTDSPASPEMTTDPHGVWMRRVGGAYISARAVVTGDVVLGKDVSIWPNVVIRGDVAPIRIGDRTNIQDGSIVHCRTGVTQTIGNDVVIGHMAVVHCLRVGDGCLIGIRAVVLDDAEVGAGSIIAAGAVVTPGTIIPPGVVAMGIPAKPVRPVAEVERAYHQMALENYLRLSKEYCEGRYPSLGRAET